MNGVRAAIREKYNLQAHKLGAGIDRYAYHRWVWEMVSQEALGLLREGLESSDREPLLLDAGCGNGRWSQLYTNSGFMVIGFDFAPMMLKAAIRRARVHGYDDRFLCLLGDLENLAMFKNEIFDAVHLYGVIGVLENPSKVVAELSRVLKPNGILLLDCPLTYGLSHITDRLHELFAPPFYRCYPSNYIEQLIGGIDCLKIEKKEPTVYIWTVGVANWLLTYVLQKADTSCLDKLNHLVQVAYDRPCGMLYLVRKTR